MTQDPSEALSNQTALKSALGDRFIRDALSDAQPKYTGCTPGTCETVLSRIISWVREEATNIFWLAGTASTGKTSIAVTICHILHDDSRVTLGGAFFCSRTTESIARTDVRCILPTLAASLAGQSPEFATALASELGKDPLAAHKHVNEQMISLLFKPLSALALSARPIIFVIDAVDEFSNRDEVAALLTVIANFKSEANVKFILTSQPNIEILGTPVSDPDHNTILQLHTLTEGEITRGRRGRRELVHERGVQRNNEAFPWSILASTVVKYILAREQVEGRQERLRTAASVATSGLTATLSLDKIYETILDGASQTGEADENKLHVTIRLIAAILASRISLSVQALAELLALSVQRLRSSLKCLHSVLYIPDDDLDPSVRALHPSFGDYMMARAPPHFRISETLGNQALAYGCITTMAKRLHFNVSQSQSSYGRNQPIKLDTITPSLEYACLHWVYHIETVARSYWNRNITLRKSLLSRVLRASSPTDTDLEDQVSEIFRPRLLFWLEVMSVLGQVRRAAAMLILAACTVRSVELARFFRDANAFVASSHEAIERSAPHIYLSALPFTSSNSLVYKTFFPLTVGIPDVNNFGIEQHDGHLVTALIGHENLVTSVAYSPDALQIVSGSADGTVRVWDTHTGEETTVPLRTADTGVRPIESCVWSVAFAPNGRSIASGTQAGIVYIWKFAAGQFTSQSLSGHAGSIHSVAYSFDGSLLASGSDDTTVHLWDPLSGELRRELRGHSARVNTVDFSPDGQIVASGSNDKTVRLWNSSTGELVRQLAYEADLAIMCLCFSPNGKTIAIASGGDIFISKMRTGKLVATLNTKSTMIMSLQFSPGGECLVLADGNKVSVTTVSRNADKALSIALNYHPGTVNCARFSPDGLFISSASDDNTIRTWNASSASYPVHPRPTRHDAGINSVAVSPDGAVIFSASDDRSVRIWDARTGEAKLPRCLKHPTPVLSVSTSSDGRFISSAGQDSIVRLWDAQTGKVIGKPLKRHSNSVMAVTFSPDTKRLVSASADKTLCIWDVESGRLSAVGPLLCDNGVYTVAWSPDGRFIAAGDAGGRMYLWHAETGQPAREPFQADQKSLHSVAFSPDGTQLASGGAEETGYVWHASAGQSTCTLRGHTGLISSVAYSPDGQIISTGSRDHTVRLWNAVTGASIASLQGHTDWVHSVTFTPDGRSVVSSSKDMTVRAFTVATVGIQLPNSGDDSLATLVSAPTEDGWRMGPSGELLLWVPVAYRQHLPDHPCTLMIEPRGVAIKFGEGGWHRGENWTSCWRNNTTNPVPRST